MIIFILEIEEIDIENIDSRLENIYKKLKDILFVRILIKKFEKSKDIFFLNYSESKEKEVYLRKKEIDEKDIVINKLEKQIGSV